MPLFRNTYRIESARLPGWDYAASGYYFITICTADHFPFFGEVVDRVMRLSSAGEIVAEEWTKTGEIRPNVSLDEWVVMPNHFHAIVILHDTVTETPCDDTTDTPNNTIVDSPRGDDAEIIRGCIVETPRRGVSTPVDQNIPVEQNRGVSTPAGENNPTSRASTAWKTGSLGAIVNQFKSKCTKRIRAAGCADFAWQSRYYDHIVRNEADLHRIREYIRCNPERWDEDRENPPRINN